MSDRPLTPKQQMFVREYLVDLNASAAYKRAGYAAKGNVAEVNASRLLRNAQVAKAVQAAKAERAQRVNIDADQVVLNILEIGQRCMQRVPVMVGQGKDRKQAMTMATDPDTGEECMVGVWTFDAQGALRAQELLGKHLKMFTDKVEVTGANGKDLFGPDQLLRMAEEVKRAKGGGK